MEPRPLRGDALVYRDRVEAEYGCEGGEPAVPAGQVSLIFTMPPPALAVHDGGVCAAWTDARNGDADVLLRCSRDDGRSWDPVRRVNDDSIGNGRGQYLPALSASPGGHLHVVFFDRRDDPQNLRTSLYYASSSDSGRSFDRNMRLSTETFDPRIGQRYIHGSAKGLVEFGSRLAVLSFDGAVLAAWPDTRNQRPAMTGQDLFTRRIELASGGGGGLPGWALVGVPLVAMVALAWHATRRRRRPTGSATEAPSSDAPG